MDDEQNAHLAVIKDWARGGTVATDRLIVALQFWLDFFADDLLAKEADRE